MSSSPISSTNEINFIANPYLSISNKVNCNKRFQMVRWTNWVESPPFQGGISGFDPRTHHQSNPNWLQNKNATINGCCIWRVSSEE